MHCACSASFWPLSQNGAVFSLSFRGKCLPLHPVRRFFVHIAFVATILCGLFGTQASVWGQGLTHHSGQREMCIDRHDGLLRAFAESRQRPPSSLLQSQRSSQRVGSSRSFRSVPTHGPGPNRGMGRWSENHLSNLLKYACLCLLRSTELLRPGTASPRFYYVIALRRILC